MINNTKLKSGSAGSNPRVAAILITPMPMMGRIKYRTMITVMMIMGPTLFLRRPCVRLPPSIRVRQGMVPSPSNVMESWTTRRGAVSPIKRCFTHGIAPNMSPAKEPRVGGDNSCSSIFFSISISWYENDSFFSSFPDNSWYSISKPKLASSGMYMSMCRNYPTPWRTMHMKVP